MNSTLVAVDSTPGSFCNPSRGPTSRISTLRTMLVPRLLRTDEDTGVPRVVQPTTRSVRPRAAAIVRS